MHGVEVIKTKFRYGMFHEQHRLVVGAQFDGRPFAFQLVLHQGGEFLHVAALAGQDERLPLLAAFQADALGLLPVLFGPSRKPPLFLVGEEDKQQRDRKEDPVDRDGGYNEQQGDYVGEIHAHGRTNPFGEVFQPLGSRGEGAGEP